MIWWIVGSAAAFLLLAGGLAIFKGGSGSGGSGGSGGGGPAPTGLQGSEIWISRAEYPSPLYKQRFLKHYREKIKPMIVHYLPGVPTAGPGAICAWETGWLSDPDAKHRVVNLNGILGIELRDKAGQLVKFPNVEENFSRLARMIDKMDCYQYARMPEYKVKAVDWLWAMYALGTGYNQNQSWLAGVQECARWIEANDNRA